MAPGTDPVGGQGKRGGAHTYTSPLFSEIQQSNTIYP